MKHHITIILAWLCALHLGAQEPVDSAAQQMAWPQSLQWRLSAIENDNLLQTSDAAVMVYDLTADSAIYAFHHQHILRPASVMKLLTAVTALDLMGADYRFTTDLLQQGETSGRTFTGDIYVVGHFDPMLTTADLLPFADKIKSMDIDTICGNLYADLSMKEETVWGEGWCWDDDNPTLSPLLVNRKSDFTRQLADVMAAQGITVKSQLGTAKCPATATKLCTLSHTLAQVLQPMMKESDNLYAEAVFYQLAWSQDHRQATAKEARAVERRLINNIGLDPSLYRVADGSGLSLYNYVSAELLVALLRYAYSRERIYQPLFASLPLMGIDGTLKSRLRDSVARGRVSAKTGTVTGVSSLAGYQQAPNGHMLAFAIINQGVMQSKLGRLFQDQICQIIAETE